MQDLGKIIEKFEDFCVCETYEAHESYKFHLRRQEPSETIEAYISSLRQLAKNCNFGVLVDRMIRDQVVMGVKEDAVREKLLEDLFLIFKSTGKMSAEPTKLLDSSPIP